MRKLGPVCVALLALAAGECGGGASSLTNQLNGRSFVSESTTGVDLVAGTRLGVSFSTDESAGATVPGPQISASAGCNALFGPYQLRGDVLVVSELGTTAIGCLQPGVAAQEGWFMSFLGSSPTLTLSDPRLVMVGSAATVTFIDRKIAFPDLPLVGTAWVGQGSTDGRVGQVGPGASDVKVLFGTDGRAAIDTSCQKGSGSFAASGSTVTFTGLAYDGAACADTTFETTSDFARGVLDGTPLTYKIEESSLTLTHAGGYALLFSAASADAGAP